MDDSTGTPPMPLLHSQRQSHPLIGYYLSRKKLAKLRFDQFLLLCKRHHIDTIELSSDYFERTPVRVPQLIVHKLDDDHVSRRLTEQIRSLPISSTVVLDRFDAIAKLLDRCEQYSLLNSNGKLFIVPPFVRIEQNASRSTVEQALLAQQIAFPLVCKPIQAHGEKSHDMKIIFDVEHLDDIDRPCVLQQFIDHNGILFKVFASKFTRLTKPKRATTLDLVGPTNYHIVQRNSIRNLHAYVDKATVSFHSSEVSSAQADHILLSKDKSVAVTVDEKLIGTIARSVQKLFELNLVGVDVIVDRCTGDYAVIDVNYFPGYEGVPDFSTELFHLCQHLLFQP